MNPDRYELKSQLCEGQLVDSSILRAHVIGGELEDTAFLRCRFSNLSVAGATWIGARMVDTAFEVCDFTDTLFRYGHFRNVTFDGCHLRGVTFQGCTFENCTFNLPREMESHYVFTRCLFVTLDSSLREQLREDEDRFEQCLYLTERRSIPAASPNTVVASSPTASPSASSGPSTDPSPQTSRFGHLEI
jgi:hypothetical protein